MAQKEKSMWELSGSELRYILERMDVRFTKFGAYVGRHRHTVYEWTMKPDLQPHIREQLVAFVGEENYMRELSNYRKRQGQPTKKLDEYLDGLIKRRQQMAVRKSPQMNEVSAI